MRRLVIGVVILLVLTLIGVVLWRMAFPGEKFVPDIAARVLSF